MILSFILNSHLQVIDQWWANKLINMQMFLVIWEFNSSIMAYFYWVALKDTIAYLYITGSNRIVIKIIKVCCHIIIQLLGERRE